MSDPQSLSERRWANSPCVSPQGAEWKGQDSLAKFEINPRLGIHVSPLRRLDPSHACIAHHACGLGEREGARKIFSF